MAGIKSGHNYSVLQTHKISKDGKVVKLLKLRNAMKAHEWTGNWSDKSPLWDEKSKKKVKFEDAKDGIFFIALEDYLSHFRSTTICFEYNLAPSATHTQSKRTSISHEFEDHEDG